MARICFVIMPFSQTDSCAEDEWTAVFETLIKPAVEGDGNLGYECRRSTATRGNLVRGILEDLQAAHVVIADLTDRNANVFYELGVRHALTDRTIIISQNRNHIPFDLQNYASHEYDWRTPEGRADFETVIRTLLRDIDEKPDRPDNPVSDFLHEVRADRRPSTADSDLGSLRQDVADVQDRLERLEGVHTGRRSGLNLSRISLLGDPPNGLTWFDVGNRDIPDTDLRSLARRTCRDVSAVLTGQIEELAKRRSEIGNVTQKDIQPLAASFIEAVQPSVQPIEAFAMGSVQRDSVDTVRALLAIAGCLITLGQKQSGLRFTSGLPSYLGWRLLLISGAAAMHARSFEALRVLLREPIEVELLGGQISYRSLPEHRDLFYPEAFLGHANYPMHHFSSVWDENLEQVFGDQQEFRESLISFLVMVAFLDTSERQLYPGYRLIEGAGRALQRLAARVLKNDGIAEGLAGVFEEDLATFRTKWAERAAKANEAQLGAGYYFVGGMIPTQVDET